MTSPTSPEGPPQQQVNDDDAKSPKVPLESNSAAVAERALRVAAARSLVEKQWDAEQENARRLGTRSNGILTTVAALSGLGFFKLGSFGSLEPMWVSVTVRVLLACSVLAMAVGVAFVLDLRPPASPESGREPWYRVRRKFLRWLRSVIADGAIPDGAHEESRTPFASSYLLSSGIPGTDAPVESPDLLKLKHHDVEKIAYYRLAQAALALHVRNMERRAGLILGQHWLFNGACMAFLAILVYILFASGAGGG